MEKDLINYGVYIDHEKSYIIALHKQTHEELKGEEHENEVADRAMDYHKTISLQRKSNGLLRKYCKTIISKLENAHKILVFGPAEAKYILQKEIEKTRSLSLQAEADVETTDKMDERGEASRFARAYYTNR